MFASNIPTESLLAEKIIIKSHKGTLHGEVLLTMTKVKSIYQIPALRKLVKSVIKKCCGYTIQNALPYTEVKPGQLPNDRTKTATSFQPYIYDVYTERGLGEGILKFVTCLRILLFLNNRSIVHFCG